MERIPDAQGWFVVVPLKALEGAKSRLALPPHLRARLARAMALDTVTAAVRCPVVLGVVVVTDVPADDFRRVGATVVADAPSAGLNAALRHGAEAVYTDVSDVGIVALTADLPALRPGDLAVALRAVPVRGAAVVADATGEGSTLLAAAVGQRLRPAFGPQSHHRHLNSGALDLTAVSGPGLRRDVDTMDDLWAAVEVGVGRRTAELLADLPIVGQEPL